MKAGIVESKKYLSGAVAVPDIPYNTEIGGLAAYIPDAATLASKLNISVGDISYFEIKGSDIKAMVNAAYVISGTFINNNTVLKAAITHYRDWEGKCTSLAQAFTVNPKLTDVHFPEVTQIQGGTGAWQFATSMFFQSAYLPKANFGQTLGYDSVLGAGLYKIYAGLNQQTINNGNPDGDLVQLVNDGGTVIYISNFTAPEVISDLTAIGNIYGTAVQLSFTPPNSLNTIDYYAVYVNGEYHSKILKSGEYVSNLSLDTEYIITVKAVDVFKNFGAHSNAVSVSTASQLNIPVSNIKTYYKFNDNVVDAKGFNNGTATGVTYADGLVGRAAVFNAAKIEAGTYNYFSNGTDDIPGSVSIILKPSNGQTFLSKSVGWANAMQFTGAVGSNSSGSHNCYFQLLSGSMNDRLFAEIPVLNMQNNRVTFTYDGSKTLAGLNGYIEAEPAHRRKLNIGGYVKQPAGGVMGIGYTNWDQRTSGWYSGEMDELIFWDKELNKGEISDINYKQKLGQELL